MFKAETLVKLSPDIIFSYFQESPGSCDLQSIQSNYSNAASDASWDQMDDPEVNVTRWVPDHMVTQCAGCEMEFTMIKRKHHCRYLISFRLLIVCLVYLLLATLLVVRFHFDRKKLCFIDRVYFITPQ